MPGPTSDLPIIPPPSSSPQVTPQHPELPFPQLKRSHILNCSYASWYPRYRSHVPKSRIIPLPEEFVDYLREDGIFLPPDEGIPSFANVIGDDTDSDTDNNYGDGNNNIMVNTGGFSVISRGLRREMDEISQRNSGGYEVGQDGKSAEEKGKERDDAEKKGLDIDNTEEGAQQIISNDNSDSIYDPTEKFRDLHEKIKSTIEELGGKVAPKLNWSAPKDATWISPTNSLQCRTASDIYLLFKSSDFITHDLEHPFDNCTNDGPAHDASTPSMSLKYALVLRKWFNINPSVEFRCFVRDRTLLAITQRDLNHYEFLESMRDDLVDLIQEFFIEKLRDTFPDSHFVFDVYIPRMQSRVWLIDINPFALRTDPILFSWLEILNLNPSTVELGDPELRLIRKDDPEAYSFNSPQYSAHKLPKEVVDAGLGGTQSIQEFAMRWRDIVNNAPDS